MIRLDGYTLTSWVQPTARTPWLRHWKHTRGLRPITMAIEVRGAAPDVQWVARLPDGITSTGTAAKVGDAKRAAEDWIKGEIAKRSEAA
jgi:hypothetical protein